MKKCVIVLCLFVGCFITSNGVGFGNPDKSESGKKVNTEIPVFTFTVINKSPWKEINDYSASDAKIFGKEVAQLISLIDHTYVIFPNRAESRPVIIKPVIYNSLDKIKRYYKNAIRKATIEKEIVRVELSQILQKGYACYSQNTEIIEGFLAKSKTPEDIKNVYNQIVIIKQ